MFFDLSGTWKVHLQENGTAFTAILPGTLDENGIGSADAGENLWQAGTLQNTGEGGQQEFVRTQPSVQDKTMRIPSRLTRRFTYEGPAVYERVFEGDLPEKTGALYLEAERSRALFLSIDGTPVPALAGSLSTPWIFDVTEVLKTGSVIALTCDNSYPGMPREDIINSSAATDETQTNWNGILGQIRIIEKPFVHIAGVCLYPGKDTVQAVVDLRRKAGTKGDLKEDYRILLQSEAFMDGQALLSVPSDAFEQAPEKNARICAGIPLRKDALRWDEYEGNLYKVYIRLMHAAAEGESEPDIKAALPGDCIDSWESTFGIRLFGANDAGRLTLNDRVFFLRGEANCAAFPETGHEPMDVTAWKEIMEKYRSYGVNCVRFHSHCPPEAAFAAADALGMMVQPELSMWNPRSALTREEQISTYENELLCILRTYANHPSFVMLTMGNELNSTVEGLLELRRFVCLARNTDPTRLYANGSNVTYGEQGCDPENDFYTAHAHRGHMLRATSSPMTGHLNQEYPSADHNYNASMKEVRKEYAKPVFGFEVGQYEVLPDFRQLDNYHGVTLPVNYELMQERVRERGLDRIWEKYIEASGELSLIGYREETEAVLRTPSRSGLSFLGLQDFPGQGTALVGMLDANLKQKPYAFAKPERFSSFFTSVLPLVLLEKYTYSEEEELHAQVQIANYGKEDLQGSVLWTLSVQEEGTQPGISGIVKGGTETFPAGCVSDAGKVQFPLISLVKGRARRLTLSVWLKDYPQVFNEYSVWVYPDVPVRKQENVHETTRLDEKAFEILRHGGCVYLSPPSTRDAIPNSIRGQFSTDFWSVGTFADQEGGMGLYIDREHPVFKDFPTECHTNWQWWAMASQRAMILPRQWDTIITQMDSICYLRPMAMLFECRCEGGRLLVSSMGLQDLQQYPEARALQASIYHYLSSEPGKTLQKIPSEDILGIFR